jgi:hypothetical protein
MIEILTMMNTIHAVSSSTYHNPGMLEIAPGKIKITVPITYMKEGLKIDGFSARRKYMKISARRTE